MVKSAIEGVKQGHYLGMKYLFEMTGVFSVVAETESIKEDSLAATLLRHLGLADNLIPERTVTKDSLHSGDEFRGHTVE